MREYKEAFGYINSINSRDTELSVDEIHDVMLRFNPDMEIDAKEVAALILEVDTDDTGNLDFPKFLKVMARTAVQTDSLTDQEDVMMGAFDFFTQQGHDRDQTDFGPDELIRIMELVRHIRHTPPLSRRVAGPRGAVAPPRAGPPPALL